MNAGSCHRLCEYLCTAESDERRKVEARQALDEAREKRLHYDLLVFSSAVQASTAPNPQPHDRKLEEAILMMTPHILDPSSTSLSLNLPMEISHRVLSPRLRDC